MADTPDLALRHSFFLLGSIPALSSLPAGQAAVCQPLQLVGSLRVGRGVPQHSRDGCVRILRAAAQHALQQGQAVLPRGRAPSNRRALKGIRTKLGLRQRPEKLTQMPPQSMS